MQDKLQYSKILPIATGLIFLGVLIKCLSLNYDSYTDTAIFATALTVSGGIFGATLKHYLNKSQAENVYKLKLGLYKDASREHYKYNERMLELKHKYGLVRTMDDDLDDIILSSFENSALSDAETTLDDSMRNASESVEIENY